MAQEAESGRPRGEPSTYIEVQSDPIEGGFHNAAANALEKARQYLKPQRGPMRARIVSASIEFEHGGGQAEVEAHQAGGVKFVVTIRIPEH